MSAAHSKSASVYLRVAGDLRAGRYVPGERLDPATLANEHSTSPTPVRFALYRLVGEGRLEDHARAGLHVPLPTEVGLRDLYDWMQRLLLIACDIGGASLARSTTKRELHALDTDVANATWQLFDSISRSAANISLHQAASQANDRLAPVRRAKQGLIEHAEEEIAELDRHWQKRDISALKVAIGSYHERRKRLVPSIVDALRSSGDRTY